MKAIAISLLLTLVLSGCAQRAELHGVAGESSKAPVAPGGVPVIEAKPEWFACKTSADCIPVTGPCGGPSGVNAQFREAYEQFVQAIAPQIDCMPVDKILPAKVGCVQNRCAVITQSE